MSVVVHFKNGKVDELREATTCTWSPKISGEPGLPISPRWLVCRNKRGEIVATYEEPSINGFQIQPPRTARRLSLPRFPLRSSK
jgi:hypothetical protein